MKGNKLRLLCIDTATGLVRRYWRSGAIAGFPRHLDHSAAKLPEGYLTRLGEAEVGRVLEHYRLTGKARPA